MSAPGPTWARRNLSFTASGLAPSTAYYFTFRATNAVDTLWAANVQSFTTLAATTPPMPVLPVSGVTFTNGVPTFTFGDGGGLQVSPRLQERAPGRHLAAGHRAGFPCPTAGAPPRTAGTCRSAIRTPPANPSASTASNPPTHSDHAIWKFTTSPEGLFCSQLSILHPPACSLAAPLPLRPGAGFLPTLHDSHWRAVH